MKQIIPFEKEIDFKTMVTEITSISIEHTLNLQDDNIINGDFIIAGTYKMTKASQIDEDFSYKIPIEIAIDSKYDATSANFDIDDFTYQIIDETKLSVHIDLLLDNLNQKQIDIPNIIEEENTNRENNTKEDDEIIEDLFKDLSTDTKLEIEQPQLNDNTNTLPSSQTPNVTSSIFSIFKDADETYSTYHVYIVREGDSLDQILENYKITKDKLEEYNNLSEIKIGDKLIIPSIK